MTLFVSAALLFLVQPMVGKMILPMLGGTPAVWNTCMLFFQACLLAGYAYAHVSLSWLGVRRQPLLHVCLLLLPLLVLPIAIGQDSVPPSGSNPVFWLLARLVLVVGLPFFVVSTSGPLLQKWFACTDHAAAHDPYFLYAASNAGSLLALLSYPLVVERLLAIPGQSHAWATGYGVFAVLTTLCAILLWRSRATLARVGTQRSSARPAEALAAAGEPSEVALRRRMWWVLATFVPSSLMLGVTTHITSDLAPVPLLWVLPLALYLLTFVLVFARKPPLPHRLMTSALPYLLVPLAVLPMLEVSAVRWAAIGIHLLTFFVAAMVCHGALAKTRPSARHLTEFYLWMSIGGVLGGVFNALVAPVAFNTFVEYPIAIVLSCLLLPQLSGAQNGKRARVLDVALPAALVVVACLLLLLARTVGRDSQVWLVLAILVAPLAIAVFSFKDRPIRFALGLGVLFVAFGWYSAWERGSALHVSRNFFGVKRVVEGPAGTLRKLIHGTTFHGIQFIDPARSHEPLAYYHRTGPLGDVFSAFPARETRTHVGIIGLGAGAIASYAQPGQTFTFYEIDPDIERIARDAHYFTFLSQCRGAYEVVLGDGRLMLENAPDHLYDMLVLDAFSSDAIPTHLLTFEALQLYLHKLTKNGLLVFHISNRFLNLELLLGNLASKAGLVGRTRKDQQIDKEDPETVGKLGSHYVVLARAPEHLGQLAHSPEWVPLQVDENTPVWTDQYTSVFSYLFKR